MEVTAMSERESILAELSKPFHPSKVTWKPGALTKTRDKAMALAYADLRAYMERLDEVCGLNWSSTYTPWGERVICHVTINGVTRSSTGEPTSESERGEISGTVAEAQAFKRTCAMFGLGRYLYEFPQTWQPFENNRFTKEAEQNLARIVQEHYKRHGGGSAVPDLSNDVDMGMGEKFEDIPGAFDNAPKAPAPAPKAEHRNTQTAADPALQKKLNILNSLGNTFYNTKKGDTAWDKKREELAKHYDVESTTHLTGEQLDTLIGGLEKKIRETLDALGGVPAEVVKECTAFGNFAGVDTTDKAKGVGLAKVLQWAKANLVPA
jgi:hypothetical protein